jgi:two-component system sensor histidine kinase UhpB
MVLHQTTLYAVLAVSGAASVAVFAGLARYAPRISGPAFWAAASGCSALAFGSGLFPIWDWRLTSLLFNIPYAIGPVLLFAGMSRFYAGESRESLVRLLVAAAIAATIAFTIAWPNTAARIAALSVVMGIGYGGAVAVAWREPPGPGRTVARLVALTFLANGLATLGRAAFILAAPVRYAFATPELEGLNSLAWVMNLLVAALSAPMLVLAVAVRLLGSLETEKRRTEASEAQFRELATSAGVGIFVTDADGRCTYGNPRWDEITGLAAGATLGDGWKVVFPPEDLPEVVARWRDAVRGDRPEVHTFRVRRPSGEVRWVRSRPIALRTPGQIRNRFLTTVEDITELRNSYERIRELAQRLETVREDERRSVAHALHEGVAQDLVAATLDLNRLRAQAGDDPKVAQACSDVSRAIDKCIGDLRELTNSLRPGTLAHLPLVTAVSQYARQFAERSGLRIRVTETSPFPRLNDATRLVFFRAVQEALTNVARHARATEVTVDLAMHPAHLTLTVSDDGVGVSEQDLGKPNALGLLAIQERFAALGGALTVTRREPRGTTVTVRVPAPDV